MNMNSQQHLLLLVSPEEVLEPSIFHTEDMSALGGTDVTTAQVGVPMLSLPLQALVAIAVKI